MEITKRAAHWTAPTGYTGTKICDIKATSSLCHSHSNRGYKKLAPAIAVCVTTLGCKVHLCSYCLSYVEVIQWLARLGYRSYGAGLSTGAIAAIGHVWRTDDGFVIPEIKEFSGSYQTLGRVAYHLAGLVKDGLVKRIGDRYLMRDACPSCFRRVCSEECMLHFGAEFAPQRESTCLHGT